MILFDLGGVLVENSTFDALDALLPFAFDRDDLRDRWLHSPAVRDFELGRTSTDEFGMRFVDEWGINMTAEEFIDRFSTWPRGPYPGAESLVARLRKSHEVSCLSNCNEIHWARFESLLGWFDSAHSSHLLGAVKPDPQVFKTVLRESGLEAGDIHFLDDSTTNVRAAERLGMHAFRADGLREAERILQSEGLLSL